MVKLSKKGITLVELLGAIVISGIAFSLMALILTLINRGTSSVLTSQKMNTEGMLIVRTIENELGSFSPNQLGNCDKSIYCVQTLKTRSLDLEDEQIVETIYDPPLEFSIYFSSGLIFINDVALFTNNLLISELSSIEIIEINLQVTLKFNIILLSPNGDSFEFLASFVFQKSI